MREDGQPAAQDDGSGSLLRPDGLSYDVVMATRNRPEAVALSLPLLLGQTRLPRTILICDSSDDPSGIEAIVAGHAKDAPVPIRFMRCAPGLTVQRNIGLAACTADVVIFPDDDSLLYADAAERMLEVYEADRDGRIAGVCARPVDRAPDETPGDLQSYAAEDVGPMRAAVRWLRQRGKEWASQDPFLSIGRRLNARHEMPPAVAALNVTTVAYMTGFRMSFRREVIAKIKFDETLKKYGWFEDIDASFGAMEHGRIVAALDARIYHHRVASSRDNGYRMGRWALLNLAYVTMKAVHRSGLGVPEDEARRILRFCRMRAAGYMLARRNAYGRDRARGARDALGPAREILAAPPERLAEIYARHEV